jgi:8-oxo-dGTP pyrophosphatase MutT (NUDIX family)/phosphohistidine phosphatase SixA
MTEFTPLLAAGTVCWSEHQGKIRVLIIKPRSRSEHGFPKGKVDPGESLQEAAVRETREEAGLEVTLGAGLGTAEYTLPAGRDKIVRYWSAEVTDEATKRTTFSPNEEIATAEWLPLKAARAKLSHHRDRDVLDRFTARVDAGRHRTFAIVALRHGKTVPGSAWNGPDSTRPLEQAGLEQARASARAIAPYRPTKLISSTAARCVSTIEPLAVLTGLDVKATARISQDAHEEGTAQVARVVERRIKRGTTAVLCSHGPVLPDILAEIARVAGDATGSGLRQAASLNVGAFAVVHVSTAQQTDRVVDVESHDPSDW